MKTSIALVLLSAGLWVGCKQFKATVATPVITELPGQFKTIATPVDNGDGTFSTNYTTVPVTQTNWVVNPTTKATVDAAGALVPGYGTMATALLGLLATGYVSWLNRRKHSIAVATIQGVEQFRDELRESGVIGLKLDEKLVKNLKYIHAAAGVAEIAQKLVRDSTKDMPEPTATTEKSVSSILAGQ